MSFPPKCWREAEAAKPATMAGREDWRDLPLVTIDPADAKDHDDAVHAIEDDDPANPGGVIATVAIADVAAYVRPGTALDREALKRGNSVYFPDRVVPMLPERISNDLCSLKELQDRPALAVRMVFAADGRKMRHSFHRIMMKSAAKLSYQQAQAAIDGTTDERTAPILDTVLKPLWNAYAVLKRGRDHRQPLDLDLPERKILLKPDGTVDRVIVPERLDAHKLIEEFMIQANVCGRRDAGGEAAEAGLPRPRRAVARQAGIAARVPAVGRPLAGARRAACRPSQFNAILERVRGSDNEGLVNEVVLRSQSQAIYTSENLGHFGLHLRRYAHFTSPIRRFADLIVHRALISALGLGKDGLTRHRGRAARRHRRTDLGHRAPRDGGRTRHGRPARLPASLPSRSTASFDARISGVTKSGLFVKLPQYGADGFIPVSTLGDDYYIYDETARALYGERGGKGYQLADPVQVRLVEVTPLAGAMRFEMLSDPKPLPGSKRSFHKSKGRGARDRASQSRSGPRRRR